MNTIETVSVTLQQKISWILIVKVSVSTGSNPFVIEMFTEDTR
jgi:hypothetical protein